MMVMLMENAALDAIRTFLEPGETAVGTMVNVMHLAATPVSWRVHARAEVISVQGHRISFRVSAYDQVEEIGRGTHERVVLELGSFGQRLAEKVQAASKELPA